ncbi:TIGR04376 family protein [Cylindrospermopsis raciborskii]|uniref:TIGR04376 family protein n=1 Tax=Cylindrospermopsis raciborskii CENA302 TaxID=1170768 RepID=A0A9Q5QVB2_9CYAN|nr:TIGR04376 family protein [Cylindrospermopsis raciborskii]MCZ2200787.1 TIGR04376 family protein [Cylindrospermopsis raciborskii PAMP2012]MCZ2204688.1 TIGR04376 family protein [Cylindrospermopsis raciborskii PAMP2011]OPH09053.1 TIGR04376 family protein [Cylindrospermopsis raciborskii CENA302]
MSLFDDLSRFLESRLEEFIRNNPHLELEMLMEQLQREEEKTIKVITDLKLQERQVQDEILATAQEIQRWHARIQKAKAAGREDLAVPAQAKEDSLLREGNQQWANMQFLKERIEQSQQLLTKVKQRREEVQAKARAMKTDKTKFSTHKGAKTGDSKFNYSNSKFDDLEEQFRRWEIQDELEEMKRNRKN